MSDEPGRIGESIRNKPGGSFGEEPKTVKVRAACVIDPQGHWNISGWDNVPDSEMMGVALDGFYHDNERRYFITAEVPLPAPPAEVAGEVERSNV